MASLLELQQALRAHVLGAGGAAGSAASPALRDLVLADGLPIETRLDIHRNNALSSSGAALAETFPVVARLVGETFFAAAARRFIRRHPPAEARLAAYGGAFPAFLGAFRPARGLPYLADVARLEWAVNHAFYAADAPPFDPATLLTLEPARMAAARFRLHPSCTPFASPYPAARIWQANQPGADATETIDLGAGGCRLLVHRRGREVCFLPLDTGSGAFIEALVRGDTLGDAQAQAAGGDPAFDLAGTLRRLLAGAVLTGLRRKP